MEMYHLEERVSEVVGKGIFITGACRSGTSMMANLLHSCRGLEVAFEPPLLRVLFPLLGEIPDMQWRLLFDGFLFEEFLMQALDGRRLNFNKNDDSFVYNAKRKDEIDARLNKKNRRYKTFPVAITQRIAFKMPEMIPWLSEFQRLVPTCKIIIMLRNPTSQIHSLLKMGWFSDKALSDTDAYWLHKNINPPYLPFWLQLDKQEEWLSMNELERCCYYYQLMYNGLSRNNGCVVVDYDAFVAEPVDQFHKILDNIGCESTEITDDLLSAVKEPGLDRYVDFGSISSEMKIKVFKVHEEAQSLVAF